MTNSSGDLPSFHGIAVSLCKDMLIPDSMVCLISYSVAAYKMKTFSLKDYD